VAFLVALIALMLINQQAASIDFDNDDKLQGTLHHVATAIGATTAALLLSNPAAIPGPSLLFGLTSACLFGYKIVQFLLECHRTKVPWAGVPGMLVIGFGAAAYISVVCIGFLISFPQK